MNPLRVNDAARIAAEVVAHLRAAGIADSDDDLAALLGSECELPGMIERLIGISQENEAFAGAIAGRIEEMERRKDRLVTQAKQLRAIVLQAMAEAGVKRLAFPCFTLTVASGGRAPLIGQPDPDRLPDHLVRLSRLPDKTAIRAALEAGEVIEGVVIGNPSPRLTVRTA